MFEYRCGCGSTDLRSIEIITTAFPHSKENRIRKAAIILGKNDGTTINSRVAYLIDFCGMDSTEILQALDNAVQNDSMWV